MKTSIVSFLGLIVALSFTACSNDSVQNSTGDYWPTSEDNSWVYTSSGVDTFIKITGTEKVNSATYYEFNQLPLFGRAVEEHPTFAIKKNKGDYYIKVAEINSTVEGVTTKITGYEFIFFKDYLSVNDSWDGTYTYTRSTHGADLHSALTEGTYTGTILEKGISLNVNGTVFNDVTRFRFTQSIDGKDDAWPTWDYSTDYWIAKDIGIIKFTDNESVSELTSHEIK